MKNNINSVGDDKVVANPSFIDKHFAAAVEEYISRITPKNNRSNIMPYNIPPLKVKEIVERIQTNPSATWLVLFDFTFVLILRKKGVDVKKIVYIAPHKAFEKATNDMGIRTVLFDTSIAKKYSNKKIKNKTLLPKEIMNMKFDVVIGNPPYQDSTRESLNNGLWVKFTHLAFDVATDTIALITPPWFNNKDIQSTIYKYNLVFLDKDVSSFFKGVGTKACMYIVKKDVNKSLSIYSHPRISALTNPLSDSIGSKVFGIGGDVMRFSKKERVNTNRENMMGERPYKAYHTKGELKSVTTESKNKTKKKIIISASGYMNPIFDNGEYSSTQSAFWAEVASKEEGLNGLTYMKSKLVRFIVEKAYKYSGFNADKTVHDLPRLDFSRSWTDDQLYQHFRLTQEEVNYIESVVK